MATLTTSRALGSRFGRSIVNRSAFAVCFGWLMAGRKQQAVMVGLMSALAPDNSIPWTFFH
eukprot:scaffold175535_cov30-Tisochrysis_lutea.AAC.3